MKNNPISLDVDTMKASVNLYVDLLVFSSILRYRFNSICKYFSTVQSICQCSSVQFYIWNYRCSGLYLNLPLVSPIGECTYFLSSVFSSICKCTGVASLERNVPAFISICKCSIVRSICKCKGFISLCNIYEYSLLHKCNSLQFWV